MLKHRLPGLRLATRLITFANSLDPDQNWQNIRPDLHPNHWKKRFDTDSVKNFLEKLISKKVNR